MSEQSPAGNNPIVSEQNSLLDGRFATITPKPYDDGALHLYGQAADGKETHLSWDGVKAEYAEDRAAAESASTGAERWMAPPNIEIKGDHVYVVPPAENSSVVETVTARPTPKTTLTAVASSSADLTFNNPKVLPGVMRRGLVNELDAARDAWLELIAKRGRSAFTIGKTRGGDDSALAAAVAAYQIKRDNVWSFEKETLHSFEDIDADEADIIFEQAKLTEKRMIAYRLENYDLRASGTYTWVQDIGAKNRKWLGGYTAVPIERAGISAQAESIYKWYGDTSGTRKERLVRAAEKAAVLGAGGMAVGALAVASSVAIPAGLAVGLVMITRVGRMFATAKVGQKGRDSQIKLRAREGRDTLLAAYGEAGEGMTQRVVKRGLLRRQKETVTDYSMTQLVNEFNENRVRANRLRVGIMAVAGLFSVTLGSELVHLVESHNPLQGMLGGHDGPQTSGRSDGAPSQQPSSNQSPETTPTQSPSGTGQTPPNNGPTGTPAPQPTIKEVPHEVTFQGGDNPWEVAQNALGSNASVTQIDHVKDISLRLNHVTEAQAYSLPIGRHWKLPNELIERYLAENAA